MVLGISIRKYQGESTDVTTKYWVEGMQVYNLEAATIGGRKKVSGEP